MLKEAIGVLDMTDEEILSHYRSMDAPPEGFDPKTASDSALRRYGLRRPDPVKEPQLRAIWDDAVARGAKLAPVGCRRLDPDQAIPLQRQDVAPELVRSMTMSLVRCPVATISKMDAVPESCCCTVVGW
jgi:hypothetical protein